MTEGKRPGGLTALAVINFVLGAIFCFGTLGMVMMIAFVTGAIELKGVDARAVEAWKQMGPTVLYVATGIVAALAFLLIASGVGYLRQSKVWGRLLGNIVALLFVANTLFQVFMRPQEADGGFTLETVAWLVYPVATLILLNTTFKEDFVR